MAKTVIVFSGGQDSTTVLAMARHQGFECYPIAFKYGQKHSVELEQAQKICDLWNLPLKIVDVCEFGSLVAPASALLNNGQNVNEESIMNKQLPASFVPNRNAMFLTMAHAYAQIVGAMTVWTGVCQTDYSGYPDCREEFVKQLEYALNLGYGTDIHFIYPLMDRTKAETFKLAEEAHALDVVIEHSHTCYNGVRDFIGEIDGKTTEGARHAWGHGCGECAACKLRAKGWDEYTNLVRIA